jgi:hypothetical protein
MLHRTKLSGLLGALGVLLVVAPSGCGDSASGPTYDPHPEPPLIMRDVALIDDAVEYTQPFVPGLRTTRPSASRPT